MGRITDNIDAAFADWIGQQNLFFVATAPLARAGHVNCSPKGGDCLRIIDAHTIAYHDLTGSGIETVAHLRENGRIVLMFCAFEGSPRIVRVYGRGEAITAAHPEFATLVAHFPPHAGTRTVVRVRVSRVADSCGFGVPFMEYRGERDTLDKWAATRGTAKLDEYRQEKNAFSIDGLPGLTE